ncbi:MAG: hypothetical protein QM754_11175 [Tepidisphaeraceae bacterium]
MTQTEPQISRPLPPSPVVSRASLNLLPMAAMGSTVAAGVLIAAVVVLANQPAWWAGFLPATIVALLCAAASAVVLRFAADKPLEKAVAVCMGALGVRLLLCLALCLVAVKVGQYPPKVTGLMIVGYYFAMLAAESAALAMAVNRATVPGQTGTHV